MDATNKKIVQQAEKHNDDSAHTPESDATRAAGWGGLPLMCKNKGALRFT